MVLMEYIHNFRHCMHLMKHHYFLLAVPVGVQMVQVLADPVVVDHMVVVVAEAVLTVPVVVLVEMVVLV
jgi:hypothetical protein